MRGGLRPGVRYEHGRTGAAAGGACAGAGHGGAGRQAADGALAHAQGEAQARAVYRGDLAGADGAHRRDGARLPVHRRAMGSGDPAAALGAGRRRGPDRGRVAAEEARGAGLCRSGPDGQRRGAGDRRRQSGEPTRAALGDGRDRPVGRRGGAAARVPRHRAGEPVRAADAGRCAFQPGADRGGADRRRGPPARAVRGAWLRGRGRACSRVERGGKGRHELNS